MQEIEIPIPAGSDIALIESTIDHAILHAGLHVTLRSTLNKYRGCIHWHLKKGKKRGTLELTLLPKEERAWFSIHQNRKGDWIDETVSTLMSHFQTDWKQD